jgi:hypothetical protein
MPRVKEKIGPRGLQIPKVVLEESGLHEGMSVIIEPAAGILRIVPEEVSAAVIRKTALRYLLHHVGDAVDVSAPRPIGNRDKWQVDVALPHRQVSLGVLTYTGSGVLLPEESTSPEDMVRKAHEA